MKFISHFNTVKQLLQQYGGKEPFALFIKSFFRQNKKYGSTDRRTITHVCYCYFRLGMALKDIPVDEKVLIGVFLCNEEYNDFLQYFKPAWNSSIHLPLAEKLAILPHRFSITDIFPWKEALSDGIDHERFCSSFLEQPDLFLRIRPGYHAGVTRKLRNAHIAFRPMGESCMALLNSTRLDNVLDINKEAVIQDYSSQLTGNAMHRPVPGLDTSALTAWDCCAASGGKSIMLYDMHPGIRLTVSDIRESILINLKKRFAEAGIKDYRSFVADLSQDRFKNPGQNFDLIIADVPCSGSGTWSRNPEAMTFFNDKEIHRYAQLQRKVIDHVLPFLGANGKFVYITCSVFKAENEQAVQYIQSQFALQLEKMEVIKGYQHKADTMFAASFQKV